MPACQSLARVPLAVPMTSSGTFSSAIGGSLWAGGRERLLGSTALVDVEWIELRAWRVAEVKRRATAAAAAAADSPNGAGAMVAGGPAATAAAAAAAAAPRRPSLGKRNSGPRLIGARGNSGPRLIQGAASRPPWIAGQADITPRRGWQ